MKIKKRHFEFIEVNELVFLNNPEHPFYLSEATLAIERASLSDFPSELFLLSVHYNEGACSGKLKKQIRKNRVNPSIYGLIYQN